RMSTVTKSDYLCQHGDTICEIRVYEQEVIVVPILLLAAFLVTLVFILLLRYCPERVDRIRPENLKNSCRAQHSNRRVLSGIDAPPGINPFEHENIALDLPSNSYATFHPPTTYASSKSLRRSVDPFSAPPQEPFKPSFIPVTQPRELPRQRLPESFNLVSPLPAAFSLRSDSAVSLYRARMDNRNVVLRVLKDTANADERHSFLGFASFLLLGVVSLKAPLVTVIEEMENRDLLSLLWRCRQTDPPCEMTERIICTMASQVASALAFLHSKDLLHGNIRARSVLVSRGYTAKLWGLHGVYTRKNQQGTQKDDSSMKKWEAPERLAKRPPNHSSDIWSFGVLLFEMASLGEAPFAEIPITELIQFHQRGKSLKKPLNCSNTLYSIIKSCSQWKESDRPSLAELTKKLSSAEKSASDKPIKSPRAVNIEQYLQEAGYGETNNYTVF
uniref:Serine/threonine/tyrosine kinase 1b n=1 Tax=Neogobius melanostomus TaxID=47308 RepID=A0A8C6SEX6_9GOBI